MISSNSILRLMTFTGAVFVSAALSYAQPEPSKIYHGRSLEQWHQIIKSTDYRTLGQPEYVTGLIEIVSDIEAPWASRRLAAETLGRVGEKAKSAVPVLQSILNDPQTDAVNTRLWVLKSFSLFGTDAAAVAQDISRIVLDDSQPLLVRINAMESLGRVGINEPVAIPTFVQVMRHAARHDDQPGSRELRLAATEALWILGPAASAALPELIDAARDSWSPQRLAAAVTIGQIGPRAEIAIPTLVDIILFDEAGEVQEVAADALGKIGASSLPALQQLMADPEEQVRRLTIRALAVIARNKAAQELLEVALIDELALIQIEAARTLLMNNPNHIDSADVLVRQLGSDDRRVRLESYRSLEKQVLNSQTVFKRLIELAGDVDASPVGRDNADKLLRKSSFESSP